MLAQKRTLVLDSRAASEAHPIGFQPDGVMHQDYDTYPYSLGTCSVKGIVDAVVGRKLGGLIGYIKIL